LPLTSRIKGKSHHLKSPLLLSVFAIVGQFDSGLTTLVFTKHIQVLIVSCFLGPDPGPA